MQGEMRVTGDTQCPREAIARPLSRRQVKSKMALAWYLRPDSAHNIHLRTSSLTSLAPHTQYIRIGKCEQWEVQQSK